MTDPPLPLPDSDELKRVVSSTESRVVYAVLYEAQEPIDINQIRAKAAERMSLPRANTQLDRRLRDLRVKFKVPAEPAPGDKKRWVYRLAGWQPEAENREDRNKISSSVAARVYSNYGACCAWCGKNPPEDGVKLVIDHLVPLDLGGTNDESNLQLLCHEHNHAKQARFAEYLEDYDALRASLPLGSVHLRIGELLKAKEGQQVSIELIKLVAREENRGDPTRRLRELRSLGWDIKSAGRKKRGKSTESFYRLVHWEPWPEEGPHVAIARIEREQKEARKRRRQADGA